MSRSDQVEYRNVKLGLESHPGEIHVVVIDQGVEIRCKMDRRMSEAFAADLEKRLIALKAMSAG